MYYMTYIWIAILVIAIVVEILTTELTSFWFAIGAAGALVVSLFHIDSYGIYIEIATFFVLSALAIIFLRPIFKKKLDTPTIPTNVDSMINKLCSVEEKVSKNHPGTVKYEGIIWTARSDETINCGDFAKIVKVEGNTLTIKKHNKEEE